MLQIVFRFLEEILWCAILWYRILICSFRSRQIWCYLELLRFSKIFNNYAICLNLIWSCHTQCNGWHLQKQVCWKLILWIEICLFSKKKIHLPMLLLWIVNQSRNHCNVCACYQPIGGGVFCMDAVWEWEDTNIRWHTEKYGSTNLRMGG